jgi:hypothetical protein
MLWTDHAGVMDPLTDGEDFGLSLNELDVHDVPAALMVDKVAAVEFVVSMVTPVNRPEDHALMTLMPLSLKAVVSCPTEIPYRS